jgi:hypothetical protein
MLRYVYEELIVRKLSGNCCRLGETSAKTRHRNGPKMLGIFVVGCGGFRFGLDS